METTDKDFIKMCRKVAKLTDINSHTESLITIATFFDMQKEKNELEAIRKEHESIGHLPYELYEKRLKIMHSMLETISDVHGEDVSKRLCEAL